jgi:hypothetical protein
MSDFSLLAYIATDSTKRSTGVGSKHMKKLIDELKSAHPTHLGMFLEIESTKEAGLDADTHKARTRRLAFYQRLGAKRMHKTYLMPSYGTAQGTAQARQGELLWVEFTASCITESALPRIIEEIFCKAYGLSKTDTTVQKVLSSFNTTDSSTSKCGGEAEQAPASSTTPGAETKSTESTGAATDKQETAKPAEQPVVTQETAKPAEQPVVTQETAKPAEQPVVTQETAKPTEQPVVTQETAKPAEQPVVTQETAKPAEQPVVTQETAKPTEQPVVTQETAKPTEQPVVTQETAKPAVQADATVPQAVSEPAPAR